MSGNTSALGLIAQEFSLRATAEAKVLRIQTHLVVTTPRRSQGSLVSEVPAALDAEVAAKRTGGDQTKKLLGRLRKRVGQGSPRELWW
ncbi:hypothetical protein ACI8AV_18120 [Geodermatophilus sp. SYSU D00804]